MPNGARNWCVTLNNYDDEEYERICHFGLTECRYYVIGKEIGEAGTPHLQCYFQCGSKRTLCQLKRRVGDRAHCEVARGSAEQNRAYCTKEDDFVEGGSPIERGSRSDVAGLVAKFRGGYSWEEALESDPALCARYPRFVDRLALKYAKPREWIPDIFVYWGQTGTGKSRRAFEEAEDPYVHSGGQWFDGYTGESDVIFDDFGGSEFKLTYLLKLLDRYPMRVPVKGGFVNWVPRKVFITSNYCPKEWFPNAKDEHVRALLRRITKTVVFRRLNCCVDDNKEEEIVIL